MPRKPVKPKKASSDRIARDVERANYRERDEVEEATAVLKHKQPKAKMRNPLLQHSIETRLRSIRNNVRNVKDG